MERNAIPCLVSLLSLPFCYQLEGIQKANMIKQSSGLFYKENGGVNDCNFWGMSENLLSVSAK